MLKPGLSVIQKLNYIQDLNLYRVQKPARNVPNLATETRKGHLKIFSDWIIMCTALPDAGGKNLFQRRNQLQLYQLRQEGEMQLTLFEFFSYCLFVKTDFVFIAGHLSIRRAANIPVTPLKDSTCCNILFCKLCLLIKPMILK